jgi:hypothetical protein
MKNIYLSEFLSDKSLKVNTLLNTFFFIVGLYSHIWLITAITILFYILIFAKVYITAKIKNVKKDLHSIIKKGLK